MKKIVTLIIALSLILPLVACSTASTKPTEGSASTASPTEGSDNKNDVIKMALLINGTLGDLAWFDSSNAGFKLIKEKYGDKVDQKVIEMTLDESKYESIVDEVCNEGYDIIVAGSWNMVQYIENASRKYPNQKFWFYDTAFDYSKGEFKNVYSMSYKQNEGAYLGGMVAGTLTKTNTVGFIGGGDQPVINDFYVGYAEGAKAVNPNCKVIVSYTNSFSDPATGKEIALAQYSAGADYIFQAASQAGLGVFEASKATGKFAIGCDTDQSALYKATDAKKAELITTSVIKDVGASLLQAFERELDGTLPYGTSEDVGVKIGCVGIAQNDYFKAAASNDLIEAIGKATEEIKNGKLVVPTAIGKSADEMAAIKAKMQQ